VPKPDGFGDWTSISGRAAFAEREPGSPLRLSISSTASNPTQVFIPTIGVCEMCARFGPEVFLSET
jgi:hypothetical protein